MGSSSKKLQFKVTPSLLKNISCCDLSWFLRFGIFQCCRSSAVFGALQLALLVASAIFGEVASLWQGPFFGEVTLVLSWVLCSTYLQGEVEAGAPHVVPSLAGMSHRLLRVMFWAFHAPATITPIGMG